MLQELFVKDFAIIDTLELSFRSGLNILSGETGAGKSIIVGALELLMGGRATRDNVRTEKKEAVVEAVFDVEQYHEVKELLAGWGIETDDNQILLRRIISKNGKSRIYIGERLATIMMLSQIGGRLIDISGQYSQQLLLQQERHIDILDEFGGLTELRARYQDLFDLFQERVGQLKMLDDEERERTGKIELLAFQNDEISRAGLAAGEEEELLQERRILLNAQSLYEKTFGAYAVMYEDENACLTVLRKLLRDIDDAANIDPDLVPVQKSLDSAVLSLEDCALTLQGYADRIPLDADRIDEVETRLDEISRLKKKYGSTVGEVLKFQETVEKELRRIETGSREAEQIRQELAGHADRLWDLAGQLTKKRNEASAKLAEQVESELATIGMKKACFSCAFTSAARQSGEDPVSSARGLNRKGSDLVEFYISTNQGEEPKPLSRIASGGEISRIVLVLKKILAGSYRVPTLLFDEVDAGIGGAVAEAVGMKLREIAGSHQVLCITHLPQIACFGMHHYSVVKAAAENRSVTRVELLDEEGRVEEIARMLGGKTISDTTREHACEMLNSLKG